ncbi:hypothetical protein BLA29_011863 [Euroglyphus maynei]|uniref:Uncharacterized protein n=1 Tax=Euroglyphus maynei TaxID=6958 RepID=A0A1Y3ATL6_EURMA|nr:hypothetical protein BLA29_011863 [Euroglyphus maynei]
MDHSTFYKITLFMISLWTIADSWPITGSRYEKYPEKRFPEMIFNTESYHQRNRFYQPEDIRRSSGINKRKFREQEYEQLDQQTDESDKNNSIYKDNLKDWFEPEAELIDSSKVSKDLINVRFMRLINKNN